MPWHFAFLWDLVSFDSVLREALLLQKDVDRMFTSPVWQVWTRTAQLAAQTEVNGKNRETKNHKVCNNSVNYSGLFAHKGICWTFLYFGNTAAGRTCRIYHNITSVQIIRGRFFAPVSFSSFVRWKRSADLRGRVGLASQGELA